MEYTIFNESLVYYAVKGKETRTYLGIGSDSEHRLHEVNLYDCHKWPIKNDAEKAGKEYFGKDNFEIRKVKVIDIGGIE